MSKIELIVNSLDEKVQRIMYELAELKSDNLALKERLVDLNTKNSKLLYSLKEKENEYETLKITNSILGSDESKTFTKLKINTLIKDIDDCISKLSD
jgi:predicted nuclease with TOPRIM domain|tara:strand:+ start:203 stop:493 length:291 start_codon:yes stop_codon:yes gene_type:complete